MTETFTHGYAAVIGVDDNNISQLALPTVAKDVQAVHDVLVHPERCAYLPENVRFLTGRESTRDNILAAVRWLGEQAAADPQATVVLYYSGHGARKNGRYYLIPYDVNYSSVYDDAIPAETFNGLVGDIAAQRLLVVLDCCHAGGMEAKSVDDALLETMSDKSGDTPIDLTTAAFPFELATAGLGLDAAGKDVDSALENIDDLLDGEGRAVLNSSKGEQKSYLRQDRTMSLFTYHFIEALTGHAPHADDATVVYVTDIMSWVTHEVKKSAAAEGRDQTPVMRTTGVFPIAQLIGGQGVAKGLGQIAPDPLTPLPEVTFDQRKQTVHGNQFNAAGDMSIGQIGDTISTGGGDYVGGDSISVGDITDASGVAIGRGASANVVQQTDGDSGATDWERAIAPVAAVVGAMAPDSMALVDQLRQELGGGPAANDAVIAGLIADLAAAAPAAATLLPSLFDIAGVEPGPITAFALSRLK